ncbi:MAG: ferredoxin domain-containing protein [Promethearchaeota archaeon]
MFKEEAVPDMRISGSDEESKSVIEVARLMLLAARTAPKGKGADDIETMILTGKDKDAVAREMRKITGKTDDHWFRDAKSVEQSPVLVLIGLKGPRILGTNCGACGFESCAKLLEAAPKEGKFFTGPNCIIKALDLGIALGSAVKTAQIHNVDNRIFFRAGVAAYRLKLLPECSIIIGIPLSATGKSIFFDR